MTFPGRFILYFKHLCLLGFFCCTHLLNAETQPLPTPLDLNTALSQAADHPRTRLTLEQQIATPPTQPLFLGCHNLAFNNTEIDDSLRNTAASNLIAPVVQQELYILRAFFDVLLSDSSLIGINEDMAGAFISFDRAKVRQELKEKSEVIVAQLEAEYQEVRQQYFSGQATQRLTRSVLAHTLNRPNDLSSDLVPPQLLKSPENLPEFDGLLAQALKNNKWLKKLKESSNKDQYALLEMDLRQQILEALLRLTVLKAAADRAEAELYRRDLDLELARTLYEMEVKASLGRSMTLQSKARMEEERVKYCTTLAWAQLNALIGQPVLSQPQQGKEQQ